MDPKDDTREAENTTDTLSLEESRELLVLIKTGNLGLVEDWIRAGKSIRVHPKNRHEPLHLAVRKGFFSLVELLARHTTDQKLKDEVLVHAVRRQRFDQVKMLVDLGANPRSVPLADVLCAWDPEMMRYFLARGTELFADDALAYALTSGIEAALGFYMDCRRNHPEWAADLKQQLSTALAVYCREGNEEWVARLMWAGADPYERVRDMQRQDRANRPDKPRPQISGVKEAVLAGKVEVLELLNLDPAHPDAQEILNDACYYLRDEVVRYLLKLGFRPNDKEDGGSSCLDTVLIRIDWGKRVEHVLPSYRDTPERCLRMAKALISHKARWTPDDYIMRATRRAACQIGPQLVSDLVGLLGRPGVCKPEVLQKLVGSRQMQDMLKK